MANNNPLGYNGKITADAGYVITLEQDAAPDGRRAPWVYGVLGIRHPACVTRTDGDTGGACEMIGAIARDKVDPAIHGHVCWGCDGWLDQPPHTPDETAALQTLRDETTDVRSTAYKAARDTLAAYYARTDQPLPPWLATAGQAELETARPHASQHESEKRPCPPHPTA